MPGQRLVHVFRAGVVAGALGVANAVSISAQIVMFSTSGTFSGGTGGTLCTTTQCAVDGFALTYSNALAADYLAPTLVDLGQFVTSFAPTGGTAGLTRINGVGFTLQVVQILPSGGVANVADGITGRFGLQPVGQLARVVADCDIVLHRVGGLQSGHRQHGQHQHPGADHERQSKSDVRQSERQRHARAGDVPAPRAGLAVLAITAAIRRRSRGRA